MGLGEGKQSGEIKSVDGHILDAGLGCGAGIARGCIDFSGLRRLLYAPGNGVFTSAIADDQYIHNVSCVLSVWSTSQSCVAQ